MSAAREVVVAVDAAGADLGPEEVAAGARLALARDAGLKVMLFGPEAQLGESAERLRIIDAPESIAKAADPVRAVRNSPLASIVQAAKAVGAGEAEALVCGGSTGAALAASLFHVKRARGIYRPALALTLPVPGSPVTLLDVGANAEVRTEHLVQFAFMGSAFATAVLGIPAPRIGLLANGSEGERGTPAVIEAHAQLRTASGIEFVGNVEGDGLTNGAAEVVVCDGFTGNVALKLIEGVSQTILGAVRAAAMSSPRAKLGGALLRPALGAFRASVDPEAQGGAYLLGLRRLGVVPHGRFTRVGFGEAILRAGRGAREDVVGLTTEALEHGGALRRPAPAVAPAAVRGRRYGGRAMSREEVFSLIQNHLSDELDIPPDRIDESTRFKEDLGADSLDLYTLVQELEDTYAVKMSDEQAAEILTVGQAVDFVVSYSDQS